MSSRIRAYIRQHHLALVCLFLILTGGTASATHPGGASTISSGDIINNGVRFEDLAAGSVGTEKIIDAGVRSPDILNGDVKNEDLAGGSVGTEAIVDGGVRSADVLDGSMTGGDVADNSLKGTDIDESTLDVGDAARAYAQVNPRSCTGTPGTCTAEQSKGVSSVTRDSIGLYCVTAPGIDAVVTPAAVTVDFGFTNEPQGNASAMTSGTKGSGCGTSGEGFFVITQRQPVIDADPGPGTIDAVGPAEFADDVAFTIVIP